MLGTFYPLDIKGDMPRCVITNRKINAETHTSEISFSSNHIFKGKKKAIANKNDYRTRGFTKLEQRTGWDQAQTVNKLDLPWGHFLLTLPDNPACQGMTLPRQATLMLYVIPDSASLTVPCPPTSTTHHTWPQTTWKTPEISTPLLFPPGLYLNSRIF